MILNFDSFNSYVSYDFMLCKDDYSIEVIPSASFIDQIKVNNKSLVDDFHWNFVLTSIIFLVWFHILLLICQ